MASTNQSPFYKKAEQEFHEATTDEERIACLEVMIKECPKHKSSEKMLKNLTLRLKKLKGNLEKQKSSGKRSSVGIRKADMQCVLEGFPNSGKSSIFKKLTDLEAKISPYPFTTQKSQLGTFDLEDCKIQIIDNPSFPNHDKSLTNSTDTILLVVDKIEQIKKSLEFLYRAKAEIIIIFNKEDILTQKEKRKIEETLKSKFKKYNYFFFSAQVTNNKIEELKKIIFRTFPIIRIYTKEPKKEPSKEPMILKRESSIKDASEKILKGLSFKVKSAKIWGPSSKFGGQTVGVAHLLKDKDVIELNIK